MARMRAIPAVVQHLLRSRADRCIPENQRGYTVDASVIRLLLHHRVKVN